MNTIYYSTDTYQSYITVSNSTTSSAYIVLPPQETYEITRHDLDDIDIFPFKVKHWITETKGSIGYYLKRHHYQALDENKLVEYHSSLNETSIEELEKILSNEGKKWLDKEMRSTMKTS